MITVTPSIETLQNRSSRGERELKFVLPNAYAPTVLPWLIATCIPHAEFPEAKISSVYYDTRDWRFLNQKVNSDFLKSKVRLRWYGSSKGKSAKSPVFIETKTKTGGERDKLRLRTTFLSTELELLSLTSPLYQEPLKLLCKEGLLGMSGLFPAFQITYRRFRFVHPFSSCVLCLDAEIKVSRVHPLRFRHFNPAPIPWAVIEQKGPLEKMDPVFLEIMRFGVSKSSFSKYLSCFHHLNDSFK